MYETKMKTSYVEKSKERKAFHKLKSASFFAFCLICILFADKVVAQQTLPPLDLKNVKLSQLFAQITKESKYVFIYTDEIGAELNKRVTIKTGQKSVAEMMELALKNTDLTYVITDHQIAVYKKKNAAQPAKSSSQRRTITGKVIDSKTNEPIIGANVWIKETTIGVITDVDGKYALSVSNAKKEQLSISYLGYETQEIPIADKAVIDIQLLEKHDTKLDEVVVVGYGTQKKVSVVGAVQSIKPSTLLIPQANLSNALAGNLAGVIATQSTGQPGADGSTFYIRGISTFGGASNSPLIILDGVAVSQGDLNALAPEVIESFSILKDATATAIYGTRGANGVMIVTTKSGRNLNKPEIHVRVENSFSAPTSIPKFVNGATWMQMHNEAVINSSNISPNGGYLGNIAGLYSQSQIANTANHTDPYIYPDEDWYHTLFNTVTSNQTANVNILGGGSKVDYFMSGTFNRENGLFKTPQLFSYNSNVFDNRFSFQNNVNVRVTSSTRVALKITSQFNQYHEPSAGADKIYGLTMNTNPVSFPGIFPNKLVANADPTEYYFGGLLGGMYNSSYQNPYAQLLAGYNEKFASTVVATIDGEQKLDFITKGLSFKALASFKNWSQTSQKRSRSFNQYQIQTNNPVNPDGTYNLYLIGSIQNPVLGFEGSSAGDRTLYYQASIDYNKNFGKHYVSGLVLYNQQEYNVNVPGSLVESLPQRKQGMAGRVTYDFDHRYQAEVNFGYNGSENFAKGHRFGFFPSAAVGYVISNEKFFKPLENIIDFMKFRGSWGLVGNDNNGTRFLYLSELDLTGAKFTTGRQLNTELKGPTYKRFAFDNISWETDEKKDLGIDLSFKNGLNITVDGFWNSRKSVFLDLAKGSVPDYMGTNETAMYGNAGELKNNGFDGSMNWDFHVTKDLLLSIKGTFTYARNKVLKSNQPAGYPANLQEIGHPSGTIWGYVAQRLFIDNNEVSKSPTQLLGGTVKGGDIKYQDYNGDGHVDSNDKVAMGYPNVPEIVYGFGCSSKYKHFDLSFFFQGTDHVSFTMNSYQPFNAPYSNGNVFQFVADNHWSPANPNPYASYPRLQQQSNPNNTQSSSFWLRSGRFLKLRNAEMGYTYKFVRFYINGYNLLCFSPFNLWDPEMGGNGLNYPTQKVLNFGIQIGLN
jgi:TonB-linked SusC/RagA family outer membrane protein